MRVDSVTIRCSLWNRFVRYGACSSAPTRRSARWEATTTSFALPALGSFSSVPIAATKRRDGGSTQRLALLLNDVDPSAAKQWGPLHEVVALNDFIDAVRSRDRAEDGPHLSRAIGTAGTSPAQPDHERHEAMKGGVDF